MRIIIIVLCALFIMMLVIAFVGEIDEYRQSEDKKAIRNESLIPLFGAFAVMVAIIIFAIIWLPNIEERLLEQRTQRELETLPVQVVMQERIIDRSLGNRVTYIVEKGGELFTWRPRSIERNQGFFVGDMITVRLNQLVLYPAKEWSDATQHSKWRMMFCRILERS